MVFDKEIKLVRSWLVLFRAHTAILEAPIAALGAALAVGSFFDIEVLKWALFGVLYHFVGYGMNSYIDWKKGYDKDDPNKEHHPLNTGDISSNSAKNVIAIMFVAMIAYSIYLTKLNPDSLVILTSMILLGVSYNYIGKATEHKYLLVAGVHSLIFLLAYSAYTSNYANIIWVGLLAYFIHHIFQILISGDVKDVKQDESSLIKNIGMGIYTSDSGKDVLDTDPSVVAITYIVALLEIVVTVAIVLFFDPNTLLIAVVALMGLWMMLEVDDIVGEGVYNRQSRVAAMSRKELAGLWMIFAAFTSQIEIKALPVMIGVSLVYFITISKFMWGSLTPDV